MSVILDAGALVAVERLHRDTIALLKREMLEGRIPVTHGGVLGQVWRGGGGRQTVLSRVLEGVDIVPLDAILGRRAGTLLGRTRTSDVIDAAVILLAVDGDVVLTSDPEDLASLAGAAALHVDVVRV